MSVVEACNERSPGTAVSRHSVGSSPKRCVEIVRVEGEYRFPPDSRRFLQTALPVTGGLLNWRSESANDLRNRYLDCPSRGVLFDVEHNDFWPG